MSTATPPDPFAIATQAVFNEVTIDPPDVDQVHPSAPVAEPWQRMTTRGQAAARRSEQFRQLNCKVWGPGLGWINQGGEYGLTFDQAPYMTVTEAIRATSGYSSILIYIGQPPPIQHLDAALQLPAWPNTDTSDRAWVSGAGGLPIPSYQDDELNRIIAGPEVELGTVGLSTRQVRLISQHVPSARELLCLIWSPREGWWRRTGAGCTPVREEAVARRLVDAATSMTSGDICHVLVPGPLGNSQPEQGPPKPVRTPIVQLVPAPIIKLLTSYPQNKTFRAQLMAVLGEMVPDEMTTWDGIKEWVEMNFPKKKALTPVRAIQSAISMRMTRHYSETGRCKYTRNMYGEAICKLDNETLMQMVTDHYDEGNSFDDLFCDVVDKMEQQINCTQDGPADTDEHEPADDGIDNEHTEYVRADLKNMIYAFIRDNCSPETQEYFGL